MGRSGTQHSAAPVPLLRRAVAELVGTGFLVAAVIGSGIAATRLSPDDAGLQLLQNSLATGAVLVALILALQPVSAAFNPVVTLVERGLGLVDTATAGALVAAQLVGGAIGAVVANLMFDLDAVTAARTLSDTFAGISPAPAPMFVLMQLVGGLLAGLLVRFLHPPAHVLQEAR
jgi:glycerol uptake facilitator-like aquaporin